MQTSECCKKVFSQEGIKSKNKTMCQMQTEGKPCGRDWMVNVITDWKNRGECPLLKMWKRKLNEDIKGNDVM